MARDGYFFAFAKRVQPLYRTPSGAIFFQACVAVLLVLTGTYQELYSFEMFAIWLFFALTAIALIRLRITEPELPRSYRVWGYPWTVLVFGIAGLAISSEFVVGSPGSLFYWHGDNLARAAVLLLLAQTRSRSSWNAGCSCGRIVLRSIVESRRDRGVHMKRRSFLYSSGVLLGASMLGSVARSCEPRSPQFKTALDLFRPFPVGMPASQVCPFCNNTRFSSPGTPCSYCR